VNAHTVAWRREPAVWITGSSQQSSSLNCQCQKVAPYRSPVARRVSPPCYLPPLHGRATVRIA